MNRDEVIKCKDCIYCLKNCFWYKKNDNGVIPMVCGLLTTAQFTVNVTDDDFCSRAELPPDKR